MRKTEPYTFRSACFEWSRIPVDGIGYIPAGALVKMPDWILKGLVEEAQMERYSLDGWRNYENKWRGLMGLDRTAGCTILDFGCGLGIESLEFAKNDNDIVLVDITTNSLSLSEKVMGLWDYAPLQKILGSEHAPYFATPEKPIDIFYANGVLHHTPTPREILQRACEVLADDGEIRIMVYSDRGWEVATGSKADQSSRAVDQDPHLYAKFVTFFDGVGFYADYFSERKLKRMFGDFLDIVSFDYITTDDRYSIATMRPK